VSLVTVGRLGRPHGLHGELALDLVALEARELLALHDFTWRGAKGETRPLVLAAVRSAIPRMLVRFDGVASREQAQPLVNGLLMIERERLPDPGPGVAWTFQLEGCEVRTVEGRVLGTLESVMSSTAHPIYVVRGEREWMIPAVESVVRSVDLKAGVITVALIPGLEEL
jgi:16S rRNA processing protein RimM